MDVPGGTQGPLALRKAGLLRLGAQVYGSRPGSLELGPAWSGSMSSPQKGPPPSCSVLQISHESRQAGPPPSRDRVLHMCGLAALCRAAVPESVSASAAMSILSRSLLL